MQISFKHTLSAALLGFCALGLSATAHAVTKKPVKKVAKKAPEPITPTGTQWKCSGGTHFHLDGNLARDQILTLYWEGKKYKLPRINTITGAERYTDEASGMDLIVIPSKAMLLNRKLGGRLGDECKTAEMEAGKPAPTRAEELRAPVPEQSLPTVPAAK